MQIKYTPSIKKNVIIISIETVNFSSNELTAFEQFGEPVLTIEKTYKGFPVEIINKKLKSLKIKVKFDGTTAGMTNATEAEGLFKEDLTETITEIMTQLMEQYASVTDELSTKTETIDIEY